ncbi:hypothetical protein [Psychroflexus halocasei]|uniref:Uncharacterized protein n=1 Tax=Psychroflexus halocasei TaxID=908615 RepID=A0A1H4DWY5_9FLAO|nr:hypothetical protein [Psychroflexus halocasei]SEA77097.1 hypothetical protein SAMN05421540_1173 [Psychroflexus halocasei]
MQRSIIVCIIIVLFFKSGFAQEKSELYILLNGTKGSVNLYTREFSESDSLQINYFQIQKEIPKEKFKYKLSIHDNEIKKLYIGTLSGGNENIVQVLARLKKREISKEKIETLKDKILYTKELNDIEFDSLKRVLTQVGSLYFLIDSGSGFYYVYERFKRE